MKTKSFVIRSVIVFLVLMLSGVAGCQPQSPPQAPVEPVEAESIPAAPVPIPGVDDEGCWETKTLHWEGVQDPEGIKAYYVKAAFEEAPGQFAEALEYDPTEDTQFDMPIDCGNVFRWAVRAENNAGVFSEWSEWVVDDSAVAPGG